MRQDHSSYLGELCKGLTQLCGDKMVAKRVMAQRDNILALAMLNLHGVHPLLAEHYAGRKSGRPPRDMVAMLRSLVLMAFCEEVSLTVWADKLKTFPELAILSGFATDDVPGVGTFYDFIARLQRGPYHTQTTKAAPNKGERGGHLRCLKEERQDLKEETQAALSQTQAGKVQLLVQQRLKNLDGILPETFVTKINEMLMVACVVPSALQDLLGSIKQLDVAGDGSSFRSQANGDGQRVCACEERCECARRYADADAQWGYDSHRKAYFFGYRLHAYTTTYQGVDFTLGLDVAPGNTADVIMAIDGDIMLWKLLKKYLPEAKIAHALRDAGYDAAWYYRLCLELGMIPVIPLARPATAENLAGVRFDANGVPLCPGGAAMKRHGFDRRKQQVCFHCPAKYLGRTNGQYVRKFDPSRCPRGCRCDDSVMGPMVSLKIHEDPRSSVILPRTSEEWKKIYAKRTSSERFFSVLKGNEGSNRRFTRRMPRVLLQMFGKAVAQHTKAWVAARFGKNLPNDPSWLLATLDQLHQESLHKARPIAA